MSPPPHGTLADLHRHYNGPIPDHLRDAALLGGGSKPPIVRGSCRDVDRLALSAVRSLARLRGSAAGEGGFRRLHVDATATRLAAALQLYRSIGTALLSADGASSSAA